MRVKKGRKEMGDAATRPSVNSNCWHHVGKSRFSCWQKSQWTFTYAKPTHSHTDCAWM